MGNDNSIVKFGAIFKVSTLDLSSYIDCPRCAALTNRSGVMTLSDHTFHYDYTHHYLSLDGSCEDVTKKYTGRAMICNECDYIAIIHEKSTNDTGVVRGEFVEYRC